MMATTAGLDAPSPPSGAGMPDIPSLLKARSRVRLPDGRKLVYTTFGHPLHHPRPPVRTFIYFHGWPSSRLEPALLHEDAAKLGLRIVAIDRPGSGHSTYNPRGHFHSLAPDIECLLDHLGLASAVLMASSGGSPYATAVASLLQHRVEALLLVCPLTPLFGREAELQQGLSPHSRRIFAAFNYAPWFARAQLAAVRQVIYLPQHTALLRLGGFAPEDVHAMNTNRPAAEIIRAASREGLRQGIRGPFRDMMLYATRPWKVELEKIRCPTVIWNGDRDVITPNCMARHYHRRIPGSRLHIVPREGHLSLPFNHGAAILASILVPPSHL